MHEGEREVEPPLHPAGVTRDLPVGGVDEPDPMDELVRTRLALALRDALQRRLQPQVVTCGEERVEGGFLQRHTDQPADLRPVLHDVVAADERRPGGRRQERRQDVDGRGLPGPVRAEEAVDLARLDDDVDAVDGAGALLVLADETADLDAVLCRFVSHLTVSTLSKSYTPAVRSTGIPIGLQLAHSAKHVGRAFNDALAEVGGSMPMWFILTNLQGAAWRTQHELARASTSRARRSRGISTGSRRTASWSAAAMRPTAARSASSSRTLDEPSTPSCSAPCRRSTAGC